MKKLFFTLVLLSSLISYSQCNQLVWSDEFSGSALDMSKWAFVKGDGCPTLCGWGNGELESYTTSTKNASVANGILTLTAVKEDVGGSSFSATKLVTLGLHAWKYGRFEAKMRMPLGRGLWPAFWMLSTNNQWPTTGEIDIMEYRGDKPKETHATLHYGLPWPNNRYDGTVYTHTKNLSDDYHVYAVEWDENQLKFYFDDILMKTETKSPNSLIPPSNSTNVWPWNTDFYVILNLAVGGGFTGNPAVDQIELTKPTFEIDYVRVYSGGSATLAPKISGASKIYANENNTYSTKSIAGATYVWSINGTNTSIVSGQNTSQVIIKNLTASECTLSVEIFKTATTLCPAEKYTDTKVIQTFKDNCMFDFQTFETNQVPSAELAKSDGVASVAANPAPNTINSTSNVLKYVRSTSQYDVLFFDNVLLRNGSSYENGEFAFELDVYSSKPIGTPIEVQIASSSAWSSAWPTGRHTVYRAMTTKTNQWETLQFALSQVGDPNRAQFNTTVDRLIVLANPNSQSSDTYYFDNLKRISVNSTSCLLTELNDFNTEKEIAKIFPTLSETSFQIQSTKKIQRLHVSDLLGNVVLQRNKMLINDFSIGEDFTRGTYIVTLHFEDGGVQQVKIQKF